MKKVYCYVEVPDEYTSLNEAYMWWSSRTRSRIAIGLHPQIEFYQMEEIEGSRKSSESTEVNKQ